MSWSEVKKINSDFAREPLNFNNYINDISIFGSRSYVLDVENSSLWRDLIVNSLAMFGHDAIHETVYNRFTDEDVDYMIRTNGQLGQSFNSFYGVTYFPAGGIDTVLSQLTAESYDVLEPKFKSGIYRYISEKTAGDEAGLWLGTLYNNDRLKAKTNIESIVSDADIWTNDIMTNVSLRRVISISQTTVEWFAANPSDAYTDFINEVCHNTDATMTLFTSLSIVNGITDFMNTESVVSVLANNRESMMAVTFMTEPFTAMISSEVAMNAVGNSDVAGEVIKDSLINVASSEVVLRGIQDNLSDIETALPNIADTEKYSTEVIATKEHIAKTLEGLVGITSRTEILVNNIHNLLDTEMAMSKIVANDTAIDAIRCNSSAWSIFVSSEVARELVRQKKSVMHKVRDNDMQITKFVAGCAGIDPLNYECFDDFCDDYDNTVAVIGLDGNGTTNVALTEIMRANLTAIKYFLAYIDKTKGYDSNNLNFGYKKFNSIEAFLDKGTTFTLYLWCDINTNWAYIVVPLVYKSPAFTKVLFSNYNSCLSSLLNTISSNSYSSGTVFHDKGMFSNPECVWEIVNSPILRGFRSTNSYIANYLWANAYTKQARDSCYNSKLFKLKGSLCGTCITTEEAAEFNQYGTTDYMKNSIMFFTNGATASSTNGNYKAKATIYGVSQSYYSSTIKYGSFSTEEFPFNSISVVYRLAVDNVVFSTGTYGGVALEVYEALEEGY